MKSTLLLAAIGVVISGYIGYNSIYLPKQKEIASILGKIAKAQTTQRTQADVAGLLEQLEQYRMRLPKEADSSSLVREVVALAKKANINLTSITQDPPQGIQQFTRLAANLQFVASYHQLGTFLDDIEHSNYFIRVERLNLTRMGEDGRGSIQLTVSTVYLPFVFNAN